MLNTSHTSAKPEAPARAAAPLPRREDRQGRRTVAGGASHRITSRNIFLFLRPGGPPEFHRPCRGGPYLLWRLMFRWLAPPATILRPSGPRLWRRSVSAVGGPGATAGNASFRFACSAGAVCAGVRRVRDAAYKYFSCSSRCRPGLPPEAGKPTRRTMLNKSHTSARPKTRRGKPRRSRQCIFSWSGAASGSGVPPLEIVSGKTKS
jgi:hypothetical protein